MPKKSLAKRSGELRSRRMKTAVKSPESAVYWRGLGIFLTETPLAAAPKHFFRPHFPVLRSVSLALSEASLRERIPCRIIPILHARP